MPKSATTSRLLPLLAATAMLLGAAPALAKPLQLPIQGLLRTIQGAPVSDGSYPMAVRLYAAPTGGDALFQDLSLGVAVQGGLFVFTLGADDKKNPLDDALFIQQQALFVAVQVGAEPELPRVPLVAVPYAVRAQHAVSAAGLACTGCVDTAALAAGSVTADKLAATVPQDLGLAKLKDLADVAKTGNYQDLGGLPNLALYAKKTDLGPIQASEQAVGIGKAPGATCGLDLATLAGSPCLQGKPALWSVVVGSQQEMDALTVDGQIAYRSDSGDAWIRLGGSWRKLLVSAVCGDGKVEGIEECDDGQANANQADKCRTSCKKPTCSDGIVDSGETCDDGNLVPTDACPLCKKATCGDGFVQAGVEECDDGPANANVADKCRTTCKKAACGDGIVDSAEACDDGNKTDNDACSNACQPGPEVFTGVVLTSDAPTKALGTIPAKAGKAVVIDKVGMCGDSDPGSGPNRFVLSGGVSLSFEAGQSQTGGATYVLPPSPDLANGGHGFTTQAVNKKGAVGQAVAVAWDYHYDWDSGACNDTDPFGTLFNDTSTGTSLRYWVAYHYE